MRTGALSAGAPLLDRTGAIAGVLVSNDEKSGITFAVSAKRVRELLESRKATPLAEFLASLPSAG